MDRSWRRFAEHRHRRYYHWEGPIPDELNALIDAVHKGEKAGPWRQLVDWLLNHVEDMPPHFRDGFEQFRQAAFP